MRKWNVLVLLNAVSFGLFAEDATAANTNEGSALPYLIIGFVILSVAAFMLYSRQKRKFND
ncbi:LPXTG-motif cell wall anchor domain-containing protein [Sphingobacterium lactis]|uniref:LPXTG-motif cell wall anchor domain-containing protein n=1 Tax=Sphingobacterium lactis TaxID=797291 RepID=A0A1H5Y3P0_9SPHI|nr:LPXTG-motif cell wall anchor domain-containing protein [Sphingobacterium lactis]